MEAFLQSLGTNGDDRTRKPGHDGLLKERLKHAFWAAAITGVLMALVFFKPFDQWIWTLQSRMLPKDASGDIVMILSDHDLADPAYPERREQLARLIERLDRGGADKIAVDVIFEEASTSRADAALENALRKSKAEVFTSSKLETAPDGTSSIRSLIPEIANNSTTVSTVSFFDVFGYSWSLPPKESDAHQTIEHLSFALSGFEPDGYELQIDYRLRAESIPTINLRDATAHDKEQALANLVSDKSIVIANGLKVAGSAEAIPGHLQIPESYIAVLGAETLKNGRIILISGHKIFAIVAILLLFTLISAHLSVRLRHAGYCLAAAIPILGITGIIWNIRVESTATIALLIFYSVPRIVARRRHISLMKDPETGLPSLKALENRITSERADGHVVVAKIHGFEKVLKVLNQEARKEYILKIVERLRATDPTLKLYIHGHYFGWIADSYQADDVVDHLEGMRALFGAPIVVTGQKVDIGITFGVASLANGPKALASASAAAVETSEANEPIVVASDDLENDLQWNISMRARIDAAMEAGELHCVYQPKVNVITGRMYGVEALVRWDDAERGPIAPMTFIPQCEKAGRMEDLTRYVLQTACNAGRYFHANDQRITMSVNVSSILFADIKIARIVQDTLLASGFDPRHLMLEVTETARITDFDTAIEVLNQIRSFGVRISIDDFGMGSANFETFVRLPFDELKIDRLFVNRMVHDRKARAIVSSLVRLGNDAGISVVAEGVESEQELEVLRKLGGTNVQGYALSRPLILGDAVSFGGHSEGLVNKQA